MKIGDRIFVRGYIDEIRKDTVIVRNDGGYFGTIPSEVITGELPSAQPEIVRCKDCKWGREVCGNIECFVDSNIPPEYHGYEWFCPNGEER